MTGADLSHAEMAERLRALLAADPLPPPRILYAAPDGRHTLSRPAVGGSRGPDRQAAAGNTAGSGGCRE